MGRTGKRVVIILTVSVALYVLFRFVMGFDGASVAIILGVVAGLVLNVVLGKDLSPEQKAELAEREKEIEEMTVVSSATGIMPSQVRLYQDILHTDAHTAAAVIALENATGEKMSLSEANLYAGHPGNLGLGAINAIAVKTNRMK